MEQLAQKEIGKKVSYNPFSSGSLLLALPTTESQREIWSTLIMDENATLCYNESLVLRLEGSIDVDCLETAFQEVLKRHDALRCFFSGDGKSFFIGEFTKNLFKRVECDTEESLIELKNNEVKHKFDLLHGPCIRATYVSGRGSISHLIITAHHLVCDGWSFAVILNEISHFYELLKERRPLPEISLNQFGEHALEEARNGLNPMHRDYWLNQFSRPLRVSPLPLDYPRPSYRSFESQRIDYVFPSDLSKKIKQFAAKEGVSLYAFLMSSHLVFIQKISGSLEVVTGMATASQSTTGKWDLVGHLVNVLPLRIAPDPEQDFKSLMKQVKSKMLDALDHQEYGLGKLIKDLHLNRDPSTIPLLNTVFNIDQQPPGQGLNFKNLKASYTTTPRVSENFELFYNVVSCEDQLGIECQFNKNLFSSKTIKNWLQSYAKLCQLLMDTPEIKLKELSLEGVVIPKSSEIKTEAIEKKLTRDQDLECKLIEIWKKVLHRDDISVRDNFFSLGGHSLLAVEVIALIKEELKVPFSVKDLFEYPTILETVSKIHTLTEKLELKAIIPRLNSNKGPLSRNQHQVWYLEELMPGTIMHNLPAALRLRFNVDPKLLEQSLRLLMERHDCLRTSFGKEDGSPIQVIHEMKDIDFQMEVETCREVDLLALIHEQAHKAFDKTKAPLIKARLYKISEEDYVFFFMAHHGIWDGWSFDIFFEELDLVYSSLVQGVKPVFPQSVEVKYVDYAAWTNEEITNGGFSHQLNYWKKKLSAPLPVLELPLDHKRPLTIGHEGAALPFTLSSELADSLRDYARKHSTSLFNVFLTAFKVTLARYTGLEDIIVGSPVRARNDSQLLSTIGYFVNTVALRSEIDLSHSFEEVLKTVSYNCVEAFSHQDLPFQAILSEIDYPRDPSRTPVFQTFFSYQDVSNRAGQIANHRYEQINVDKASTHTELDLWIKANESKIEGAFDFRTDLFEKITVQRFLECFLYLLQELPNNHGKALNSLEILPLNQRQTVLTEWNNSYSDPSKLKCFIYHFEEMVRLYPEKTALENNQRQLSYRELDRLANRCAHGLIRHGVRPGDLVGIALNREINLVIGLLGILKAGGGYVPLDPSFPQDRLDYMVESSSPRVLLTEKSLRERFIHSSFLTIEELINDNTLMQDSPEIHHDLRDPMYVIYTSGSTGKPKGVQVSHLAIINFLTSVQKRPGLSQADRLLAVTTISFDIAALELYLPLMTGATIYLAASLDVIDGSALKSIIEKKYINCMQATPSTWRLLLGAGWKGGDHFKVLCGGEPFPLDLAQELSSICPSVWNMYGPTETTVWSTCKKVEKNFERITLGSPLDNTYLYVLDETQMLCPIGRVGELYIGGLGLADGYYGREDLTRERFVPNPFRLGEKMYATGDYVRLLADGNMECLGRKDGQVKVRGYRIELSEIEAAVNAIDNKLECSTVAMEIAPKDVRLVAFVRSEGTVDEKKLRECLAQTLPKYMIPSCFVGLKEMPKTLNGKIDKKVLPSLFPKNQHGTQGYPINEKTSTNDGALHEIWSEVLGLGDFPRDKSFFDIGGNSLLAVQMFTKINQKLGKDIPLSKLIEFQSFDEFSKELGQDKSVVLEKVQLPQAFQSLLAIKANGTRPPVFCFHGVGGNVMNYMSLAPYTKDRPLMALQSHGANNSSFHTSIEEMAREYIKEIKIVQGHGPYCLAGGSMGGMIALEVAIQLKQKGDQIERLIMFDTFGPDVDIRSYDKTERSFWKNFKISFYYKRRCFISGLKARILRALGLPIPLDIRLFELEMNNYRALWKYRPGIYKGDLDLIRGKIRPKGWYSDPHMGWQRTITGDIRTYEINGTHGDFIEAPELGPALEKLL